MNKVALLHRLNPTHWPEWEQHIPPGQDVDIWFETGRRVASEIHSGLPVFVPGTDGIGVVATGETVSGVEYCPDPLWMIAPEAERSRYTEPANRVRVRLHRINIPIASIRSNPMVSSLPNTARETTTWLNSGQYLALVDLARVNDD